MTSRGLSRIWRVLRPPGKTLYSDPGSFLEPDARYVPDYLMHDKQYSGGIAPQFDNPGEGKPVGAGWVARQWDHGAPALPALLAALAKRFDGEVYGVNLPETAIDIDEKNPPAGFTCDSYFAGEMENLAFARKVFRNHMWCST